MSLTGYQELIKITEYYPKIFQNTGGILQQDTKLPLDTIIGGKQDKK